MRRRRAAEAAEAVLRFTRRPEVRSSR